LITETGSKFESATGGSKSFRDSRRNFTTEAKTSPRYTEELSVPMSATASKM